MPKPSKINAFSDSYFAHHRTLDQAFHFKLSENYPLYLSSVFQNPNVRPYQPRFSLFFPFSQRFVTISSVILSNSVIIFFFHRNTGRIPFLLFCFYQKKNDRILGNSTQNTVVYYILYSFSAIRPRSGPVAARNHFIPADTHRSGERWILPGSWLP